MTRKSSHKLRLDKIICHFNSGHVSTILLIDRWVLVAWSKKAFYKKPLDFSAAAEDRSQLSRLGQQLSRPSSKLSVALNFSVRYMLTSCDKKYWTLVKKKSHAYMFKVMSKQFCKIIPLSKNTNNAISLLLIIFQRQAQRL